jgi:hypothetical protein
MKEVIRKILKEETNENLLDNLRHFFKKEKMSSNSVDKKSEEERFRCEDCGDTDYKMYMVNDDIWKKYGNDTKTLCKSCLEKRLGRPLKKSDVHQYKDTLTNLHNKEIQILKEQDEKLKEKFLRNMKSLEYILQSGIKSNIIEEVEFVNIEFIESYEDISAEIEVKSYCEDLDIGALTDQMNKIEDEIFRILKNYEFLENGKLTKVDGDSYLMMFPIKVDWKSSNGELFMEFFLRQDEYREIQ